MQVCTPCRQPHQHPTTQFFYRPDALPDAQPTASKHWRQSTEGTGLLEASANTSSGCTLLVQQTWSSKCSLSDRTTPSNFATLTCSIWGDWVRLNILMQESDIVLFLWFVAYLLSSSCRHVDLCTFLRKKNTRVYNYSLRRIFSSFLENVSLEGSKNAKMAKT